MLKVIAALTAAGAPWFVPWAVAAAILVELICYFTLARRGFWTDRRRFVSAFAAYLAYSIPCGVFRWDALALLAAVASAMVWWLPLVRRRPWLDLGYLAFVAGAHLANWDGFVYADPAPDARVDILGQLLLFRLGVSSYLFHRESAHLRFGFLPTLDEWRIGARQYLTFMVPCMALVWALGLAQLRVVDGAWWKAPAYFLAALWVISVGEEILFRGVLLEQLRTRFGAPAALAVSSIAFGLVHLPYGRQFPNWKMAVLAGLAGVFFGRAYLEGRGVRAAMAAHALVVPTFKTLLAL